MVDAEPSLDTSGTPERGRVVLLMGVCGSGKTSVGQAVAESLVPGHDNAAVVNRYFGTFIVFGVLSTIGGLALFVRWRREPPPEAGAVTMDHVRAAAAEADGAEAGAGGGGGAGDGLSKHDLDALQQQQEQRVPVVARSGSAKTGSSDGFESVTLDSQGSSEPSV